MAGSPNRESGWHSAAGSANYIDLRDMGNVLSLPAFSLSCRQHRTRPCKERKDGAPTVLVTPARSRARATRRAQDSLPSLNDFFLEIR
jgi:hypothetical protein